jgi:hypothetical protein
LDASNAAAASDLARFAAGGASPPLARPAEPLPGLSRFSGVAAAAKTGVGARLPLPSSAAALVP